MEVLKSMLIHKIAACQQTEVDTIRSSFILHIHTVWPFLNKIHT